MKNFILYIFLALSSISFAELDRLTSMEDKPELRDGKEKKKKTKPLKKLKGNIRKKLFQRAVKKKTHRIIKHKKHTKKRKFTPKNNRYRKKSFRAEKHKHKRIKRKNIWNGDGR